MKTKTILMPISAILLASTFAFAADNELRITDNRGVTRVIAEVKGAGAVQLELVTTTGTPANAVPLSLTNTGNGEMLSTTTTNGGLAYFDRVSPGTWSVSSRTQGIALKTAIVNPNSGPLAQMAAGGGAGSAGGAGGTGAAAGAGSAGTAGAAGAGTAAGTAGATTAAGTAAGATTAAGTAAGATGAAGAAAGAGASAAAAGATAAAGVAGVSTAAVATGAVAVAGAGVAAGTVTDNNDDPSPVS